LPQVASAPVISPPARSDAPARTAGQSEPSGAFGELLEASSAAPDGSASKPAQANSKDASAQPAQGDTPADAAPTATTLGVDLALLVPELPVAVGIPNLTAAATAKGEGEAPPVTAEAAPADPAKQADDPANETSSDTKLAEISIVALVAPAPPAPASAPIAATSEPASGPIAAAGANSLPLSAINETMPAVVPAQLAQATAQLPASNEVEAGLPQANTTAKSPLAETTAASVEVSVADSALAIAPEPARAKPAGADESKEERKPDTKTANVSKAEIAPGKEHNTLQVATKPAQPHPSDAPRSADQPAEQDPKPAAHQPHAQPSEHASATARATVAAAQSDLAAPTSVAQVATAQAASTPTLFGLNAAIPLTSPLQGLWQSTAQRADSTDNSIPISGLAVEIVSRAQDGLRRFEIRLDPPELGRIDVRLDVDRGGNVTSRLTVERAETLDLLRRDAPQLERALQHAGLNTEGGLQFSLRDQNFANREQTAQNAPTLIVPDDEPAAAEAARRGYGRLIGLGGGVDIRV
jgi:flagellar hook-length control protein FliK